VFQSLYLIPSLTVLENVTLPLIIAGAPQSTAEEKAMDFLQKLFIEKKAQDSPEQLSKGQQQRVAIARALINDAKILVCDEPTSALDEHAGADSMQLLKDISQQPDHTVIVVTHDQRTFRYADRKITLNDGQ